MCSVEKCVPLGAELQVWNRDVNLPLRETTTHSSVVAEDRWLSLSNASPLRYSIAKLDVNRTGKGGRREPHYLFMKHACILIVRLFMASKHMHEAARCSIFKAEGRHGHSGGKSHNQNNG